jgi:hypothetical protein
METTTSNISPWLHSFQYANGATNVGTIDELIRRTKGIEKRINSLLNKMYELDEKRGRLSHSSHLSITNHAINMRDAIGVYMIYAPHHLRRTHEPNMIWCKEQLTFERTRYKEGSLWMDYFGDDTGITNEGGYVVVSLSNSGISYLNTISEGVYSLSSSYTTTE